jgi:hypothetical protein
VNVVLPVDDTDRDPPGDEHPSVERATSTVTATTVAASLPLMGAT